MNSSQVTYDSASIYINSSTTYADRIVKIDSIIEALLLLATTAAEKEDIQEYWLDSGQTKIKTVYRGMASIMASIQNFEKIKQYYINKINGHSFRLIDSSNFRRQ